jgi:hypothetical protein
MDVSNDASFNCIKLIRKSGFINPPRVLRGENRIYGKIGKIKD